MVQVNGNSAKTTERDLTIPSTVVPPKVYLWNIVYFVLLWIIIWKLGDKYVTPELFKIFHYLSFVIAGVLFGLSYYAGINSVSVDDFRGALGFDSIGKERRVFFPGLHWTIPFFESIEKRKNLKGIKEEKFWELHRAISVDITEKWGTIVQTLNMDARFILIMYPDTSGTPHEASEKFKRFSSYEDGAIGRAAEFKVGSIFSTYYSKNTINVLNKEADVVEQVFADQAEGIANKNKQIFIDFQRQHGVVLEMILKNSSPDAETRRIMLPVVTAEQDGLAFKEYLKAGVPKNAIIPFMKFGKPGYTEMKIDVPKGSDVYMVGGVGMGGGFAPTTKKGKKKE
ncbi:MAG: hypothetical protein NT068_03080 [Candidatus Nomurabacteria bacterium]|nr:hypothetical protein [Candidatus Nomurabacteria bacterium]